LIAARLGFPPDFPSVEAATALVSGCAGEHAPGLLKPPPVGLLPIQVTFGPGTVRAAVGG